MTWQDRYPPERLRPYDESWATQYAFFATVLTSALGRGFLVEHVGSTSVPGLSAKPVIDLAVGEPLGRDVDEAAPALAAAGWTTPIALGDHRAMFWLDGPVRRAIVHVFASPQWAEAHVRLFAAWLRDHEADRLAYDRLKHDLVAADVWGHEYTRRKSGFVLDIVNRARAGRGLTPVDEL